RNRRPRELHSGRRRTLLVRCAVADVKGTLRRNGKTLQGELEDPGRRLCDARVGRGDHHREGVPQAELFQTRRQREVEVRDDCELEPTPSEPLEGLADSGEELE